MKLKKTVNLLLIALFVVAFQSKTIHFAEHAIDAISECQVCEVTENLDLSHQNSSTLVLTESFAVETKKSEEKIVLKSKFDYAEPSLLHKQNIVPTKPYASRHLPLAFDATAPPYFIS
jgi:hypothetical protein